MGCDYIAFFGFQCHHDSWSVQRRLFLISSNGFSFCKNTNNATVVYFLPCLSFFPLKFFLCLAVRTILFTRSPISASGFLLWVNHFISSLSLSSYLIFEPCLFLLLFVFMGISSGLSFSLSLPFWSHILILPGHQFHVPFVSDLPHEASYPPTSPQTGDSLALLHSCHPWTAFPVPLSLSTSSATLKLSL